MRNIFLTIFGSFIIVCSRNVFAACGTVETTCDQYSGDRLVHHSTCTFQSCANVHGFISIWKLPDGTTMSSGKSDGEGYKSGNFVNGVPSKTFRKNGRSTEEKWQCFGTRKKGPILCGKIESAV